MLFSSQSKRSMLLVVSILLQWLSMFRDDASSALAFSPSRGACKCDPCSRPTTRTCTRRLRHWHLHGLFATEGDQQGEPQQPQINPNDLETAEERSARMDMVRQIQEAFYRADEDGSGSAPGTAAVSAVDAATGSVGAVPLWRVQWTELPGYQNVLHVHAAHYTHMFQSIVRGPPPWLFGHLHLPGGSDHLTSDEYRLGDPDSRQTRWGTLMRISDFRQMEDDGRLLLIVQAVGRYRVESVGRDGPPYSVAETVELRPDAELVAEHYAAALEKVARTADNGDDNDGGDTSFAGSGGRRDALEALAWEAARVVSVNEALHWRDFEYNDVRVGDTVDGAVEASPLVNFDAAGIPSGPFDGETVLDAFLARVRSGSVCIDALPPPPEEVLLDPDEAARKMRARTLGLEKEVWKDLDFLIQLLTALTPNADVPVPTQLLGLLPPDQEWPEGFKLDGFVERLKEEKAIVGTASRSPFVSVSEAAPDYPALRRAQRLSFGIWVLLDNVLAGYAPAGSIRQDVLELESIEKRLDAALRGLNALNSTLKKTLEQRS